ncbi:MAG: hypothetical protein WAW26_07765, partial [Anaerolineae bacterium]
ANRQPPGPPTPSTGPDPHRSAARNVGQRRPQQKHDLPPPPAEPDRTDLGKPATPSIPTACPWTPPQQSRPTVCVTRAGAGGGTPSDWKKDKA